MKTRFGWFESRGKRYEHDIVIHTDGSITKRKKKLSKPLKEKYGHTPLSAEELAFLEKERPKVVYIGTGQYGNLPVTPEATTLLEAYKSVIKETPAILRRLKKEKRKYVAVLHVTC